MHAPMSSADWQADADAHTLAQVHEIERDGPRLARARAAAHRKAEAMKAAAGTSVNGTGPEEQLMSGYRKLP